MSPDDAGDALIDMMFAPLWAADRREALGHRGFVLTRLYESA